MKSKKYNNIKLGIRIFKGITSFILIVGFVYFHFSLVLENFLRHYISNGYILFLAFILLTGFTGILLFFPINFYRDYYLEHKYDLSNQTFGKWIFENFKGLVISLIIGIPILLIFYYMLNKFGEFWWLPFAFILFIISVVAARLIPVVILPLFYKITPFDNEELKIRITRIAEDSGIKVENIFKFNMSKNTRKANAAFTGLGKSKRILLGDTLLDNYSNDEIETVIAHELGHYKRKHIIKNIIIGTTASFGTLFLIAYLYSISLNWFGFVKLQEVAALPILPIWAMLIGLIETPLTNILSRKFEYEADEYAIAITNKPSAFITTLNKLTDQNLADIQPHPLVEWFFYSHPSITKRVSAIRKYMIECGIKEDDISLEEI
ncbi:MAG TPA: M48 family metallopeptidase [Ignavibacteriaceae bacterium]|nr:M48 family metallopeptidase [Ignavibacteriaceae bacterium]